MLIAIAAIVAVIVLVIVFASSYKVVGSNEAHIVVFMGRGRKIYSPVAAEGVKAKTAYFFFPMVMKRYIMPLTNVKDDIQNIPLNDKEMAPFVCDVVAWLHIEDPVKAAERLDFSSGNAFTSLHQDLTAIVQAIARASSMKQEILDIMRDRKTFSDGVSKEVDIVLEQWGVRLVNLEVNDIRDADNSSVIRNYEEIRKAGVQSLARIQIAARNREAVEKEQENRQAAEIATANAEKALRTAQISKDEAVGIANQKQEQNVATAAGEANKTKVEALRVMTVGQASVNKEAAITTAEGEGEAIRIKGEKAANIVSLTGKAEGDAIEAKGTAEAKVKDLMAKALKEFNEAGIDITKINANVTIQTAFAEAYAEIAKNADIKVVTGGEGANILGLPMNAKTGADIGQMVEAFGGMDAIKGFFANKAKPVTTTE